MKVLVAGWFSFENCGATAGDTIVRDLILDWLQSAGIESDYATAPPFKGGIQWQNTDPRSYSHVVFVCGPFINDWPGTEFLEHFRGVKLIGVNLSMIQSLREWNPFDVLFERDSDRMTRPDLTFLVEPARIPVLGVILVHPQHEYGARGKHKEVHRLINKLITETKVATVKIDTQLDYNSAGLRTSAEIESLISRMDASITTRLHGMVFSIRNGVPPLVIDPILGGAKISKQAKVIQWPAVLNVENCSIDRMKAWLDFCLSPEAYQAVKESKRRALDALSDVRRELLASFIGESDQP